MTEVVYVVYDSLDYQEYGEFKTLMEAKQRIKELKEFDKAHDNPWAGEMKYFIMREEYKQ